MADECWMPLGEALTKYPDLLPGPLVPMRAGDPCGYRLEEFFGRLRGEGVIRVRVRPDLLAGHKELPPHELSRFYLEERPPSWIMRHANEGTVLYDVQVLVTRQATTPPPTANVRALNESAPAARRGPRPQKRDRVEQAMEEDLRSKNLTPEQLLKEKKLETWAAEHGVSKGTAYDALKAVTRSFRSKGII